VPFVHKNNQQHRKERNTRKNVVAGNQKAKKRAIGKPFHVVAFSSDLRGCRKRQIVLSSKD
jgi:hypothetical protein